MAGQFQNDLALESMTVWAKSINSLGGKWEGNDIHIDEVKGFESIQREDWIEASFEVLELLTPEILMVEGKFFFLYIPLQEARNKIEIEKLNRKWLNEHLDDFTPPSFHYTSIDYFNE
jgi:hypothetical protein